MKLRVFIVEDSPVIRESIIEAITGLESCAVVGVAESEQEAVDLIRRDWPDVIVTDIRLRSGTGIGVIHATRAAKHMPDPLIFVLTNYAYPEYRQRCVDAGAQYFFDKIREYDSFLSTLASVGQTAEH
jgi:DNA-binding NarL/FixJ family response regulator